MVTWDSFVTVKEYAVLTAAKKFTIDYYIKVKVIHQVVRVREQYPKRRKMCSQLVSKKLWKKREQSS